MIRLTLIFIFLSAAALADGSHTHAPDPRVDALIEWVEGVRSAVAPLAETPPAEPPVATLPPGDTPFVGCEGCTEIWNHSKKPGELDRLGPAPVIEDGEMKFAVEHPRLSADGKNVWRGPGAGGQLIIHFPTIAPDNAIIMKWKERRDLNFFKAAEITNSAPKIATLQSPLPDPPCSLSEVVIGGTYLLGGYNGGDRNKPMSGDSGCNSFEPFHTKPTPNPSVIEQQPGGDNTCLYTHKIAPIDKPGGCYLYLPNEVYTFEFRVDLAADPNVKSRIRLWVTRESRGRELVIDYYRLLVDAEKGFGRARLGPVYQTGRGRITKAGGSEAHETGHIWVRGLSITMEPLDLGEKQ